jgi:hypothetical protein
MGAAGHRRSPITSLANFQLRTLAYECLSTLARGIWPARSCRAFSVLVILALVRAVRH